MKEYVDRVGFYWDKAHKTLQIMVMFEDIFHTGLKI
jgi:hypothetical protein